MMNTNKNILLFDGVCNLCNTMVKFVKKYDKEKTFLFISLQSASGIEILRNMEIPVDQLETIVLIRNDEYFIQSTAVLKIFKILGGFWSPLSIFIIIPLPIRDWVYKLVSRWRYRLFGKRETCDIF